MQSKNAIKKGAAITIPTLQTDDVHYFAIQLPVSPHNPEGVEYETSLPSVARS